MKSTVLLSYHGISEGARKSYVPPHRKDVLDLFLSENERLIELEELVLSMYLLDRNYPNETELIHPVKETEIWIPLQKSIQELFYFLTGRDIILKFEKAQTSRATQTRLFDSTKGLYEQSAPTCLFSGGLDSTAGAISLSRSGTVLLSHTITGKKVYGKVLALHANPKLFDLCLVLTDDQVRGVKPGRSQLRGLLFLINASIISSSLGHDRVALPENGPLMINPQVSELSHPTRNAHPFLVRRLENIMGELTQKTFSIDCILKEKTKSEVVASLLKEPELVHQTYSCFTVQGQRKMCGLCYACYIRRCSYWCVGLDEPSGLYEDNPFIIDLSSLGDISVQKVNVLKDSLAFFNKLLHDDELVTSVLHDIPDGFFKDPVLLLRNFAAEVLLGTHLCLKTIQVERLNALGKFALGLMSKDVDMAILDRRREELLTLIAASK